VEDQSAPIPEEISSELGRIILMDDGRPMRAVKASLATPLGEMRNREGPHRLYAETTDPTQRDVQTSDALADGTPSARLTVKTVADPKSLI
jgi:hypothetical protein